MRGWRWLGIAWLAGCGGCLDAGTLPTLGSGSGTSSSGSGSTGAVSGEGTAAEGSTGAPGPSAAQLYAQARCAAAQACDCSIEQFETTAECELSMQSRFLAWQDGFADGGDFDLDCFTQVLSFYEEVGCRTHQEIALEDLAPQCLIYAGSQLMGQSCVSGGGVAVRGDLCGGDGLDCLPTIDGYQCHPARNYDALTPALGETCAVDGKVKAVCDAGLFCEHELSGTCQARVPIGETCPNLNSCESGTYCDTDDPQQQVCALEQPPGTPCISTSQCAQTDCESGACTRPVCHEQQCRVDLPQVCFLSDL